MGTIFTLGLAFGFITLVFLSPACMNIGLIKMSSEDYEISRKEFMLCCIPIFNHFYGWNRYANSRMSLSGISSILIIFAFFIRFIVTMFFHENETVQVVTIYMFLIAMLLFWVLTAVNIYGVLSDSGVYTTAFKILYSVTIILGQIAIGYYMPNKVKYYSTKEKGSLYERG